MSKKASRWVDFKGLQQAAANLPSDAHWSDVRDAVVSDRVHAESAAAKLSPIRPKTDNQKAYWSAMRNSRITLCEGPAGVGKTLLACATAAQALEKKVVERVMFIRPLVTVGPGIGFLPGTLQEKLGPFVTHIMRHLEKVVSAAKLRTLLKEERIVFEAVQYLRGHSWEKIFVVGDEMQNANRVEHYMLMTRMETGTRIVLNGDTEQTDIPNSYFHTACGKFEGRDSEISVVRMDDSDILRSRIVKKVVQIFREPD